MTGPECHPKRYQLRPRISCFPLVPFYFFFKGDIVFVIFIYLFLAVLGLHCCAGFSLVVASGGYPLVVAHGLLVASLVLEHDP